MALRPTDDDGDLELVPKDDVCAVCLESFNDAYKTPCGHFFCKSCIEQSLEQTAKRMCPMCRRRISHFNVVNCVTRQALRQPEVTSPMDNCTYIQGGRIGLASYHFSRSRCFIYYKSGVISDDWRLDDLSPPPEEKDFVDWSYEPETRTFRGAIVWDPVTFRGDKFWGYRLVFDEGFEQITGGECHMIRTDGTMHSYSVGAHCKYRRVRDTIFDSVYVLRQGGIGCASYHFLERGSFVDFSNPPVWWVDEMAEGFPSKLYFDNPSFNPRDRTFVGTINLSATPFGNEVLWLYQMVFDESYSVIESGFVTAYGVDGSVVDKRPFATQQQQIENALEYVLLEPWDLES